MDVVAGNRSMRRWHGALRLLMVMVLAAAVVACDREVDTGGPDVPEATFSALPIVDGNGLARVDPSDAVSEPLAGVHEPEPEGEVGKPRDDGNVVGRSVDAPRPKGTSATQFPLPGGVVPPDPTVAASRGFVLVTQNGFLTRMSKAGDGVGLVDQVELGPVLGNPSSQPIDPHVQWDPGTNSFWVSALILTLDAENNPVESRIALAQTLDADDPFGRWQPWDVIVAGGSLLDQPQLQITSELVVVSWTVVNRGGRNDRVVIDKNTLSRSAMPRVTAAIGVGLPAPHLVPARSVSSPAPFVGVAHATGSDRLRVWFVSAESSTRLRNVDVELPIAQTRRPPRATQPGGPPLDTGDDRFESAFLTAGGRIWVTGTDACIPPGDITLRACLRLVELAVDGDLAAPRPAVRVLQDFDIGQNGADLMYPSVVVAPGSGSVLVSHFVSSLTQSLTAGITIVPGGRVAPEVPGIDYGAGSGALDCCSRARDTRNRIGDYSGAVIDPETPEVVWTVGQVSEATPASPADFRLELGRFVLP